MHQNAGGWNKHGCQRASRVHPGAEFYTGVPDSQLQALCNYLMNTYGIDPHHHVIAANEGNCTAMAAGYHLRQVRPSGVICKIVV